MTSSVILLLSFFAILLFIYIVVISILLLKKYLQQEKANSFTLPEHDYVLIYASQSGQTEDYAKKIAGQLQSVDQHVILLNIEQVKAEHLKQAKSILWMVSSYGDGDAPDTAQHFNHSILNQQFDLSHQSFAVLAFGDRRYAQFCAFGQRLYTWLLAQNAQPWFDLVTVNQYATTDLVHWNTQLEKITHCQIQLEALTKQWQTLTLSERVLLNEGSQGTGLYHIRFDIPQGMLWQSGDILEIQCCNSKMALQTFSEAHPHVNIENLKLLINKNLRYLPEQLVGQSVEDWLKSFNDLPIREYSIASIPEQKYLDLVVRQEVLEHGVGVGSGLLTQYLNIGESIQVYIRSNPSFHLIDQNQPTIFIGNGSGIAGLLSHLHQRKQWGNTKNWLIYGERQKQFDSIFHTELQMWKRNGFLTNLDLAFSQDEQSIKYVQDILLAKQDQLKNWVEQGASIYVCGSLKGMAQSVDQVLISIFGTDYIEKMRLQKRYQRDAY